MAPDLNSKRLELLKEAFPKVAPVALLWGGFARGNQTKKMTETAAKALGIELIALK